MGVLGCMQCSQRSEEDARSPETGDSFITNEYGYWESNLGPLEEQPTLLTTEPSLQPSSYLWNQPVTELGVL